jgi:hypothetical protein
MQVYDLLGKTSLIRYIKERHRISPHIVISHIISIFIKTLKKGNLLTHYLHCYIKIHEHDNC